MLSAQENKLVISTLTQRRAWLKKTLENASLEPEQRKEHSQNLGVLESAMKKLAATSKTSTAKEVISPPVTNKPKRSSLTLNNARILVADDDESSAELLCGLLEDMGVKEIEMALDGRDAFDKIKRAEPPYDFVFCDWDMPELSGMEVYQKAKASNTLHDAHFCMVTSVTEAKKIREAIQGGVNDYIVKPVDGSKLEEKIKASIEARNTAT
ncbi:response regulator [Agaribacterium sp. ZY112]|uniref:response regulator n=1 Tax=Agaribacterium sp. ZY112 TaxID=3233574 RepID=UPI00352464AE